jgi:hypothetical protein
MIWSHYTLTHSLAYIGIDQNNPAVHVYRILYHVCMVQHPSCFTSGPLAAEPAVASSVSTPADGTMESALEQYLYAMLTQSAGLATTASNNQQEQKTFPVNEALVGKSFTSPMHEHALVYGKCTYDGKTYGCDLCKIGGQGAVFHCSICDFDAHPHCFIPPTEQDEGKSDEKESDSIDPNNPHKMAKRQYYLCDPAMHPHKLQYLNEGIHGREWYCDVCGAKGKPSVPMLSCFKCNWDCCPGCFIPHDPLKHAPLEENSVEAQLSWNPTRTSSIHEHALTYQNYCMSTNGLYRCDMCNQVRAGPVFQCNKCLPRMWCCTCFVDDGPGSFPFTSKLLRLLSADERDVDAAEESIHINAASMLQFDPDADGISRPTYAGIAAAILTYQTARKAWVSWHINTDTHLFN